MISHRSTMTFLYGDKFVPGRNKIYMYNIMYINVY